MAFAVMNTQNEENTQRSTVDYDAMNKSIVEQAGLQSRETIPGIISMIVDLGLQKQEDAKVESKVKPEDEEAEIEKYPATYFVTENDPKTKQPTRYKCWPQKPKQAVAVVADFPEIVVDKGEFYGKSNPQPLRLVLGRTFWMKSKKMQIVAQPTMLKEVKGDNGWSFSPLHLLYKMAVSAKLIKAGDVFKPEMIDKLLGTTHLFDVEVSLNESNGKNYLNEYIKFSGGLARGMQPYPVENCHLVMFNADNDPEALKQLRAHIVNTMTLSTAWSGSKIQKQLEELGKVEKGVDNSDAEREESPSPGSKVKVETPPKNQPARNTVPRVIEEEDDDSSLPF